MTGTLSKNPEFFVIEEINRLETGWNAQDEWIEQSFQHGRSTGEYYGQTGNEHLRVDEGVRQTTEPGDAVYLGSVLANVIIYGVVSDATAWNSAATLTLTLASDDGALTLPALEIPQGLPGPPLICPENHYYPPPPYFRLTPTATSTWTDSNHSDTQPTTVSP